MLLQHFHICVIISGDSKDNQQMGQSHILGRVILLANLHAKGAGHVYLNVAGSVSDENIAVFRYIFVSCKSIDELFIQFAT